MKKWESVLQMMRFTEDANDGILTDKSHYLLLYAITHLVKPQRAIEIGSRRAGSAMWIARAMEEIGRGHLTCIDPFVSRHGGAEGFLLHFNYNLSELGLDHRVTLIKELSVPVPWGLLWKQPAEAVTVGLLFIDGDHSYDGCVADIRNYAPLVEPGGALVIHDSIREPNVRSAIADCEDILSVFVSNTVENQQGVWIGFKGV